MNSSSVVTHSLDAEGVGWIVFDDPSGRANVFNRETQAAFASALAALAAQPVKALVLTSAKDRIFIAGADLKWLGGLPDVDAATDFARAGQHLFQRVANFKAPVVCAIHGACAGGGFELALACQWRIASDAAVTQIGLPETSLGTIPGWGGSVRLPRLIGAQAALGHILKAQLLSPADALKAGLVDEIAPADELKARAKAAALKLAGGGVAPRSMPPAAEPGFFAELRQQTLARTRGHQPALVTVIDVVERTQNLSIEVGLEVEARAFGEVTAGAVCKNLVHVFFLRDAAKKRTLADWFPASPAKPHPIARVGVVGAGVMGSGIAQWLAAHGYDVVLRDVLPEFIERGRAVIRGLFDEAVQRGKLSAADASAGLGRVATTARWEGFERCDLVIEAIVENVAAKQQLFSELAAVMPADALLASNTSALPIEEIAGHVLNLARTLGLHFFNPVSRMSLVELIVGRNTSAEAAERALALVKALGKSPVICRSSPGFLVTRVLFFYLNAAVKLWEEGVATATIDGALREFGWPMGPLRLIDEVGLDVTDSIFGEMAHYFPERFTRTTACAWLLAAGLKGRKNGAGSGFYTYAGDREVVNENATHRGAGSGSATETRVHAEEITERLMRVMISEAQCCLDEGVVKSPDDVDFALLSGAGFPAFRGGLMRYAQAQGMVDVSA